MALLASAQPARGSRPLIGAITNFPFFTLMSTASSAPTPISASKGFGMMTPRELPTFRIDVFMECYHVVETLL
jgi:hypothetical protein